MLNRAEDADSDFVEDPEFQCINLWCTDFDSDGFWMLCPVIPRPLQTSDFINLVSRAIWKEILSISGEKGVPSAERMMPAIVGYLGDYLPPDMPSFSRELDDSLEAFRSLKRLGKAGLKLCRELVQLSSSPSEKLENICRIGDQIADIDREITLNGMKLPSVNHLVLDFNICKQNLEGGQISHVAGQTELLYDKLYDGARRFIALLENWGDIFKAVGWMPSRKSSDEGSEMPLAGVELPLSEAGMRDVCRA